MAGTYILFKSELDLDDEATKKRQGKKAIKLAIHELNKLNLGSATKEIILLLQIAMDQLE